MDEMIDTPAGIAAYHMLAQRGALKLEIAGMRHSSGRSVSAHIKRTYGIKGRTKKEVLENFEALLREKGILPEIVEQEFCEVINGDYLREEYLVTLYDNGNISIYSDRTTGSVTFLSKGEFKKYVKMLLRLDERL